MNPSILVRLSQQPHALSHLLPGLTEDQVRQRPQSENWSIFENLAHLGRYQEVFRDRLQQIITNVTPHFDRYVADNDPDFSVWTRLPFPTVLDRLQHERAALNDFLSKLSDEQLICVGLHPAFGPMTVEGWTEFFLLHEAHHFFTILKLGGALRTEDQPMGNFS